MSAPAKKYLDVGAQRMAYVDEGSGDPVLFLHGNPTSSFLWRDIVGRLASGFHCIAPDLIGMGDSAKLTGSDAYSFATHAQFLDGFIDALGLAKPLVLVVHDWGSGLGFDWARRHPQRVRGIAYMEAIVRPLTWDEWPASSRELFQALRGPAGEQLILDKNIFVEKILPASIQRELSATEMAEYRRPFSTPADRQPTLAWPRSLPIDNEPADVCARVRDYADWLATSDFPKLFINAEPGAILVGAQREFCRSWPNQTEMTVAGIHFIQEDSAAEISAALGDWLESLP